MYPSVSIRFPHTAFSALHGQLLADPGQEAFAVLLARREQVGEVEILRVVDQRIPTAADYRDRSLTHLRLDSGFIHRILAELTERADVDTLIDVHTHPFCPSGVAFSGRDDADEARFLTFLQQHFDGLHYASIVLSRSDYAARRWHLLEECHALPAEVRTQTAVEGWPRAGAGAMASVLDEQWSRSIAALGLETMGRITREQRIAVIGVGGLGSIIAEHLVHMGFPELVLVDPDVLEPSNLNRVVGARFVDARRRVPKVRALARHLRGINPRVQIKPHQGGVADTAIQATLARCHWLMVGTDNHLSRFQAQQFCLRSGVPLISAGVNISAHDGAIQDMSGEVITVRLGDRLCLGCLGRIHPTALAADAHPEAGVREALVSRGYVAGRSVVEPAVKTLNSAVATLAVEVLMNQYTGRQPHQPILVYENNRLPTIYPDQDSVRFRPPCFSCGE